MNDEAETLARAFINGISASWTDVRPLLLNVISDGVATRHPLGFACIKSVNHGKYCLRTHLWHSYERTYQKPNWLVHDHVFGFRSLVILGSITNEFYEVIDSTSPNSCLYETTYGATCSYLNKTDKVFQCNKIRTEHIPAGQEYAIGARRFHSSDVPTGQSAMTVLITCADGNPVGPYVVGDLHGASTYSYERSNQIAEERLREMRLDALEKIQAFTWYR